MLACCAIYQVQNYPLPAAALVCKEDRAAAAGSKSGLGEGRAGTYHGISSASPQLSQSDCVIQIYNFN